MTEKVKVSREVAAILEEVWSIEAENVKNTIRSEIFIKMSQQAQEDVIIDRIVRVYQDEEDGGFYNYYGKEQMKKIYEVFPTIRMFIKVLDVGWEVEQTPEEQVVEEYQYWLKALNNYEGKELERADYGRKQFASGFVSAVAKLSQIHEIKGVNA